MLANVVPGVKLLLEVLTAAPAGNVKYSPAFPTGALGVQLAAVVQFVSAPSPVHVMPPVKVTVIAVPVFARTAGSPVEFKLSVGVPVTEVPLLISVYVPIFGVPLKLIKFVEASATSPL